MPLPLSTVQKSLLLLSSVVLLSRVDSQIPRHNISISANPVDDTRILLAGLDNWNDPKSVELRSNTGVTYKECMHHVESKRLPTLITKISENPEVNGIIPHLSGTMEHMKGLDLSVFRGKRIAVMGDSTLFYLVKWLYALVMKLKNEGADEPKYEEMRLSEASALVLQRLTEFGIVGRGAPPPIKISDGTWVEWMGMAGPNSSMLKKKMRTMFVRAKRMNPDIVVANMGFHWLHLCGFKLCPSSQVHGPLMISTWANYKKDWLQRVYDMAVKVNAKLLLFKTNNFICDEKRSNDWATWSSRYLSLDSKTIEDCYKGNMKFSHSHNIPMDQILSYCKYGQFTEIGVKHLNDQIIDFVGEIHRNTSNSTLTVGIFNDHDIEGCYSTEDSIHHPLNMLMRLRLLSNTIESYSECSLPMILK